MASDHVLALSHIAVFGAGLMTVAILSRGLAQARRRRVRSDDILRRARPPRLILRRGIRILRGVVRLVARLGLALATPVGLLSANRRYPLVAPVLAPFEKQLATRGHRTAPARYFPLLVRNVWLVRCAGCQRRVFLLEVPSLDGTAIDLKVMGTSSWGAHPCAAEYLTAQPSRVADTIRPVRIVRPVQQRTASTPAARADQEHAGVTDKTA